MCEMNIFTYVGDVFHLAAILTLLATIKLNNSCAGVSFKTQILLAIVFTVRYLDIFLGNFSKYLYLDFMKSLFIALSYTTLAIIYFNYYSSYERSKDNCSIIYILLPTLLYGFLLNYVTLEYGVNSWKQFLLHPLEISWAFSIYLEALAIIPQYLMILNTKNGEPVRKYIIFLALYRIFYIGNWIYRYFNENHNDPISFFSGLLQVTILLKATIAIRHFGVVSAKKQLLTEIFTIQARKIIQEKLSIAENYSSSDKEQLIQEKV
ncbi:ER lumen protein-retaining receptor 1-like [Sitophilus oryzae]|uniref:ER lumen protein-retaining receptor 1-like n=1 Tax=Sitophilus oryzae TaxID=7048 RepID=A0A6J2XEC1_SITOR|nr:ER lumen protein-retaining receptor 1-like [Sitophilus oryzae]